MTNVVAPARAAFVAELKRLISRNGTDRSKLARRIGVSRMVISAAVRGEQHGSPKLLPSPHVVEGLDRELNAGGRLIALWQDAVMERTADEIKLDRGQQLALAPTVDSRGLGEEAGTDRREFVELTALSALAAAAQTRMDEAVTPSTLDELEADADEIARAYGSAPHTALLPEVGARWRQITSILDGPVAPESRPRITLLGGQFTYFLGRLAFNADDMRSARRFAGLAGRYATEVGDPVLILSVAALRSSISYWRQRYGPALDALQAVRHITDPYMTARIAAYEARTYAALGDIPAAREALDRMEATAGTFTPRPGSTPVGPAGVAMFRAGAALALGDMDEARRWAALAVDGYQRRGGDYSAEESHHATLTLALAHVRGARPEPEEAARIAGTVLAETPVPAHTVGDKLRSLGRAFSADHRRLPEVAAYVEAYRALPAGTGAS
jgi:transcriptional regulator with XRE-family HTH domain